ncbi:MAG: homoserine dehydrogenase [Erysipelotrichaceae bacterium]
MRIGILGYGTVGSGVYDIINKNQGNRMNDIEVIKILRHHQNQCTSEVMCCDFSELLNSKLDLIVECMGGIEPAHTYIVEALSHGHHVVSANKAVIAKYLKEFHDLANKHCVSFNYEASCGGGIPWIASLQKAMRIDNITSLHGIFNGTSNFILDHMERNSASYEDVLKQAQALGYAEHDPSDDVNGADCMRKIYITSALAYESILPSYIPFFGIENLRLSDILLFKKWGLNLRLIGESKCVSLNYAAVVEPMLYDTHSVESATHDNNNLGCLLGETIGELKFYGQGAGKFPTANAIIQDIIDIKEQIKPTSYTFPNIVKRSDTLLHGTYVLRCKVNDQTKFLINEIKQEIIKYDQATYIITKDIPCSMMHAYCAKFIKYDNELFFARFVNERKGV